MSESVFQRNLRNRRWLIERVRAEVIGPDPTGEALYDPEASGLCMTWDDIRQPFCTEGGEEVLWLDPPSKRYGAGILFPLDTFIDSSPDHDERKDSANNAGSGFDDLNDDDLKQNEKINRNADSFGDSSEENEVNPIDNFLPSSMSLSFLADLDLVDDYITVELVNVARYGTSDSEIEFTPMGRYISKSLELFNRNNGSSTTRSFFIRSPILDHQGQIPFLKINKEDLLNKRVHSVRHDDVEGLRIQVVSRTWKEKPSARLITISLLNMSRGSKETNSVFQAGLRVSSSSSDEWILPYPEYSKLQQELADIDTRIIRLNYESHKAFAIGHGVGTDWSVSFSTGVGSVWTDAMPLYELPSTTPDLRFKNEQGELEYLKISMKKLSGRDEGNGQFSEIDRLLYEYDRWITNLKNSTNKTKNSGDEEVTEEILERLSHCQQRIKQGRKLLDDKARPEILRAFELANLAMYLAQSRNKKDRNPIWGNSSSKYEFDQEYQRVDLNKISEGKGYWRPFQIAFLLMSLKGLVEEDSFDRDEVDLIWFPTGGGKTEAYLGVIAFLLFYKRLTGKSDDGITVLMRYTLRLLTAQQFERATTLFCAMEFLRKEFISELGDKRYSVGLWVGMATSPNKRSEALRQLASLREKPEDAENPFILRRCPWCAAKFGAFRTPGGNQVLGYVAERDTVIYRCPDHECEFSEESDPLFPQSKDPLPVTVIDEDLIESPPDLLVGTVDKFAMLAWKPELRSLFGIDDEGMCAGDPPTLIIQDELHLISGPLGTIVGAYETAIEELCTKGGIDGIRPKIIASTATISNANEQVKNLYARNRCSIFPPAGTEANESFFATVSREKDGTKSPGRIYVGVMAPAYQSLQTTQARVFASLLQWPSVADWTDDERDPWWTLLCFFNSLRELGSAATLLLADTREYLRVITSRHGLDMSTQFRKSLFPTELTSRIPSHQIPEILNQLEVSYTSSKESNKTSFRSSAVDACLASNIIEVGVDVPRLSLMSLVGQPKTTAQYIQVSSRVGRASEKPGLVFTLYSANKARDISHYEKFKNYHQKIYSFVEPTSVTPFSIPSVERTLHAILVILVRQLSDISTTAVDPAEEIPEHLLDYVKKVLERRISIVSPEDREYVLKRLEDRINEWKHWIPSEYGAFMGLPEDPALMYQAGQTPPDTWIKNSWATLTSMRGVDGTAEAGVTTYFNRPTENAQESTE